MGKAKPKKVEGFIKLQIEAGKANSAPPIGPALGQKGINIMEFCKAFNDKTKSQMGMKLPTIITVYADRSFTFITKTPPASFLIKKNLNLKSGSQKPGHEVAGKVSEKHVREVAGVKMPDLTAGSEEAAMRTVEGSCRSMGLKLDYKEY